MKKQGFTLAEVLITLGIIGVVAALTIPTLINKSRNQEYLSALRKFNATFASALKQIAVDSGCAGDLKCTGIFTGNTRNDSTTSAGDALAQYLKATKNCKMVSSQKCFPAMTYTLSSSTTSSTLDSNGGTYKFITLDGMSVIVESGSATNCDFPNNWNGSTVWGAGPLQSVCGIVYVDVNGLKNPNKMGRDTFRFFITGSADLVPYGAHSLDSPQYQWNGTSFSNRCVDSKVDNDYGYGCAGRIIEEGWEMNY